MLGGACDSKVGNVDPVSILPVAPRRK
jgi:hypothetical protein